MEQLHLGGRLALSIEAVHLVSAFSVVVALGTWPESTAAQPPAPTDFVTCFCLQHDTSKQVMHGCKGTLLPKATAVTAICAGEGPTDKASRITVVPPWSVIPDGAERCNPCNAAPPVVSRPPRGDGTP
jgi:hypothetical protein